MDCVAPGHMVSKVRPLLVVDVAGGEQFLQALLESLLWSPSLTMVSGELAEHEDLWKAMIFHSANMTSPSELVFQDHGYDAGNLGLLYVKDGAQAALVEALEEADVGAVGDPLRSPSCRDEW